MLILYTLVATLCAWFAAHLVRGKIPGGLGALIIIGVLGAWTGGSLLGHIGPSIAGVPLAPAMAGCTILLFIFHLLTNRGAVSRR